jgi:hypothetical protein
VSSIASALAALLLVACSGQKSPSDEEVSDLRAEVADLRAEQRAMRQEIREMRESIREPGEEPAPADAGPATAAPAAAPPPPATQPPPTQGSVNIQVESNPAGAAVFVAGKKVGVTPVIIKSPVGSGELSVRLEKAGYRPRLMTLRPEEDTKISVQLAKKGE